MKVDYSLYLVTDSTQAILGSRDLCAVVESALQGGVTFVQYRNKTDDTAELVRCAKKLHGITQKHHVPLVINDRVDVALAVGAEGVHLGQDDLDLLTARKLLGRDAIIGATANSFEEACKAVEEGADYLGIGTVFATLTKENSTSIIGTAGLRDILAHLSRSSSRQIPKVCIGGINASNVQRVLYQSASPIVSSSARLDGVAVVSAIIGSESPKQSAITLKQLISNPPPFASNAPEFLARRSLRHSVMPLIPEVIERLGATKPLCHNMTNLVVQNFAANVALAIGGSPIMSNNGAEAADLAKLKGSLVINMGTATPDSLAQYKAATLAYNLVGGPVVLDPVGAGATAIRRAAVLELMAAGYFDVIKGNESEIITVFSGGSEETTQHGVDSSGSLSEDEKAAMVKALATRERNVVLMTGATDYLSDGARVYSVNNGTEMLGSVTGSGCTLGTTIAACLAVERDDKLLATLSGLLMFEIAAERATAVVEGPGSFIPAFIDKLHQIKQDIREGDWDFCKSAKVKEVTLA